MKQRNTFSSAPLEEALLQNKNTLAVLIGRAPEFTNIGGGSLDRLPIPTV
jgi:hypothetical protein